MRKTLIVAAFALVAMPGSALAADSTPTPAQLAKQACKTEKSEMGTRLFKTTYAAKSTARAMEACAAKRGPVVAADAKNAAHECKDERDANATTFAEQYGTGKNNKNAFGKCVSSKTREATDEETEDRVNAATTCKTLRMSDKAKFETDYGTKKNAFGKCVSATAKADDVA